MTTSPTKKGVTKFLQFISVPNFKYLELNSYADGSVF